MATPAEKLASSLEALQALQKQGKNAIRSTDLTRAHRERLTKNGFLSEVMKGWYIPARPDETAGESTAWYASYWGFCADYLYERFDDNWCLSPEQSLAILTGNMVVPTQLLVRSPKARNKVTEFVHGTSLFDVTAKLPDKTQIITIDGLRLFSIPAALVAAAPASYSQTPVEMRAALASVRDSSEVLGLLLDGGHSTIAGRLAGAFRNIGRERVANDILAAMRAADYDVREDDPFDTTLPPIGDRHDRSPVSLRIELMWQQMRKDIIGMFPEQEGAPDIKTYLSNVDEIYVTDAYNSLSIEGYRVSAELIEKVRQGDWNPDANEQDREHRDALAARGYWQAFQSVRKSIEAVLGGENPGNIADKKHRDWYRELFGPSITAGILKASDLAGYRNMPVFIRRSKHVPPPVEAMRDAMPTFFKLLESETDPAVRIVLGHFIFVYIHPYTDGNGRLGRFLMNLMMAAGGYSWTIIPVERRDEYMAALEIASVEQNIIPFAEFLTDCMQA